MPWRVLGSDRDEPAAQFRATVRRQPSTAACRLAAHGLPVRAQIRNLPARRLTRDTRPRPRPNAYYARSRTRRVPSADWLFVGDLEATRRLSLSSPALPVRRPAVDSTCKRGDAI